MKHIRKGIIAFGAALISIAPVLAQTAVAPAFQNAVTDITSIAMAAGTLIAGLVGLIGLGRTAYKLSNGDGDAMTSLLMAIVGIVLGFLASTFL
jgi:FtsH-binding integral membrane protein